MHFIDFIKTLPKQQDERVQQAIDLFVQDKDFPKHSNPSKLAIYLYLKLDEELTSTYQKLLLFYAHQKNNKLPKRCFAREDMLLHAVSMITFLQNFDPDFDKWDNS